MVSHFEIFDYWKDKGISKEGEIIKATSVDSIDDIVILDWGEPCCWGCGRPIISNYEKSVDRLNIDLKLLWNHKEVTTKLNRCHIVPKALGGSDLPDNLFLMCESCHTESPDTINKKAFIRWVYLKRFNYSMGSPKPHTVLSWIEKDISNRDLPTLAGILNMLPGIYKQNPELYPKELYKIFSTNGFREFAKRRINSHEFKISTNSLITVAVDYILNEFTNAHLYNY